MHVPLHKRDKDSEQISLSIGDWEKVEMAIVNALQFSNYLKIFFFASFWRNNSINCTLNIQLKSDLCGDKS